MDSLHLLDRLIAFPTVSDRSNLQLISFVREFLTSRGFEVMLVKDDTGWKVAAQAWDKVTPDNPLPRLTEA